MTVNKNLAIKNFDSHFLFFSVMSHSNEEKPTEEKMKSKNKFLIPPRTDEIAAMYSRFEPKSFSDCQLVYHYDKVRNDSDENGFSAEPIDYNICNWKIQYFNIPKNCQFFQDMQEYADKTKRNYVEINLKFPEDIKCSPPVAHLVQPRFQLNSGLASQDGSLNISILKPDNWNPTFDIKNLLDTIFSEMMNGNPRVDFTNLDPYPIQGSKL